MLQAAHLDVVIYDKSGTLTSDQVPLNLLPSWLAATHSCRLWSEQPLITMCVQALLSLIGQTHAPWQRHAFADSAMHVMQCDW